MSKEVKRYNFDMDKFGSPRAYESEHGRWMKRADYEALLAERDRLKEALAAMLEIHGVTQRYADTHIEIPQSWVEVSDLARAAMQGAQP